jgi:signal peptidase II
MLGRSDAILLVALAASVAAIDQLTKALLASAIDSGRLASRVTIVDDWLALEYTENRGAAFGLFSGLAPILTGVSIAIVAGLLWHYLHHARPSLLQTLATGAITGGAIGNLVDRIRLGYVIDFVSVGPWPNFNVADSAITVGALVLVWGLTRPASGLASEQPIDQGS